MPYNLVGTPRFYIDGLTWLRSLGLAEPFGSPDVFNLNPSNQTTIATTNGTHQAWKIMIDAPLEINYFMLLGHNFAGYHNGDILASSPQGEHGNVGSLWDDFDQSLGINFQKDGGNAIFTTYNGYTIGGITKRKIYPGQVHYGYYQNTAPATFSPSKLSCFCLGNYYDLPHSPDLNLTMSREYDGIKTIQTKGGASLSNAYYTKPPSWGDQGAWELQNDTGSYGVGNAKKLSKSGRRTWDLSFSYLDDGDIFGSNQELSMLAQEGYYHPGSGTFGMTDGDWEASDIYTQGAFNYNLLTDNNFYSQVIHKTNGGQLPFVFQPNKDDGTTFAICKFDMKSFKFEQVANGVYNMKLKIREVW